MSDKKELHKNMSSVEIAEFAIKHAGEPFRLPGIEGKCILIGYSSTYFRFSTNQGTDAYDFPYRISFWEEPQPVVDRSRYPRTCPVCKAPAYVGSYEIDCSAKCGLYKF